MSKYFEKCPICGGELVKKTVEKLLRGGNNTATLNVNADVCLHCGERLYNQKTINKFEEIRDKLEKQQIQEFELLGNAYKV